MAETLTGRQLRRRRKLAIKELLYVYREEYARILSSLGSACHALVKQTSATSLTESQKRVLNARYEEFIKGKMAVIKQEGSEGTEMEKLGIPIACGTRIEMKGNFLTFAQAEAYVARQMSTALRSSRLEPHLSSSPFGSVDDSLSLNLDKKERMRTRSADATKTAEICRLESIARSSSFREMDRRDHLVTMLGRVGKYSIRQSSFTIGCILHPSEKLTPPAAPIKDVSQSMGRKRKFLGDSLTHNIDIDLSMEGCSSTESEIYALIRMTSGGLLFLESTGIKEIVVDQKKVAPGETVPLVCCSVVEIGAIPLMIMVNVNAANRVRKRSKFETNI